MEALFDGLLLTLFYLAVQWSLRDGRQARLDQAAMLPFADDPEVAARMERATSRSRSGCPCPGRCHGACRRHASLWP